MAAYANTSTEAGSGIFTFSGLNPNNKYTVRGYASRKYGSSDAASTERLKSGGTYSNSVFPYQNSVASMVIEDLAPDSNGQLIVKLVSNSPANANNTVINFLIIEEYEN